MKQDQVSTNTREAHLWEALVPVVALIVVLAVNIRWFDGPAHLPLVLGAAVAGLFGIRLGYSWKTLEAGIVKGISIALPAILILMVIGILIGTSITSGVVPVMIYYGLQLLSPQVFLVATCLICAVVSLATGSSWTTAGTVGVALIGVGQGLGVALPMVAGAVVSGAYFGDKMSPLSDTTNLSPAVVGAQLFEHIGHMMYTTIPSLVVALLLYGLLGGLITVDNSAVEHLPALLDALQQNFNLHPLLMLLPVLVIAMVVIRVPALPALFVGAVLGAGLAIVGQGQGPGHVLAVAMDGYISETGTEAIDSLLTRGGLRSMMDTIALILCAMSFGGIMERTGMLHVLAARILSLARSTGSLVVAVVFTCFGMNVVAPDQYLSIIVPGRMYREAFARARLHPKNLSRILEDAGTLSSPLVAWNTCGAYMFGALGVSPMAYLPFAFLNLLNPLISILYGYTGWTMEKLDRPNDA